MPAPMIRTLKPKDRGYEKALAALNRFADPDPKVSATVAEIIARVRKDGDAALCHYARKFDGVKMTTAMLPLKDTAKRPPTKVCRAIAHSLTNIRAFSKPQRARNWRGANKEGASVGELFRPLDRVGIYVPGGTAPLVSTALMTVGIAKVAGVSEIVVTTPPPVEGTLHYALQAAGATEIYNTGGAQAVAALAYGTKTIRRVQKIFGPGNAYVVEAKRQAVGAVAIDQLPGPSEIAVIADSTANPAYVAADLLAQAEHGHGSQILLLSPSARVLDAVRKAMDVQLPSLSRQDYLKDVLSHGAFFVQSRSLDHAFELVDAYAPEHLSLACKDARNRARDVHNAGAIFIGNDSPVAAGDFIAGPSHTLPTGGAAKSFPGLTVDQFFRRTSIVEYSAKTLAPVVPHIVTFAEVEHLDAHGRSAAIRVQKAGAKKPVRRKKR